MRDFQRKRLYDWESEEFGWDDTILTLDQCQQLTNTLIRGIVCKDGRGRRSPCAKYNKKEIALPKFSRKKWIVIHEVAHFVKRDMHGPKFVRAYIEILAREYGRSIDSLVSSAEEVGLKVAPQPAPEKTKICSKTSDLRVSI